MNCAEFQRELPDFMEDGGSAELQSHLKTCGDCSGLVTSLQSIIHEAQYLQATDEPSPRVWNSLEIILRQEKIIREPRASTFNSAIVAATLGYCCLAGSGRGGRIDRRRDHDDPPSECRHHPASDRQELRSNPHQTRAMSSCCKKSQCARP